MDDAQVTVMSTEQLDIPGDSGRLVKIPPRKAKTQKTVKSSTQPQMESCEICGKSFKKGRGLSIHQTKAGCKSVLENRIKNKSKLRGPQDTNHSGSTNTPTQDRQPLQPEAFHNDKRESIPKTSVPEENCTTINDHAKKKDDCETSKSQIEKSPSRIPSMNVTPEDAPQKEKAPSLPSRNPQKQRESDAPQERKALPVKQPRKMQDYFSQKPKTPTPDQVPTEKQKILSANLKKSKADQQDILHSGTREGTIEEIATGMMSQYKRLAREIHSGDPDENLSTHTLNMTRRDYRSLSGVNWLNDKIVDEYFTLIRERNEKQNLAKIYTLITHAYKKLDQNFNENYKLIAERWVKVDLMKVDKVIIPIHKDDHWSLIVVVMQSQKIEYYDSIIGRRKTSNAPRIFKKFFQQVCRRSWEGGKI